ncbi:uncharacterized [Tachysurus ichikawai]
MKTTPVVTVRVHLLNSAPCNRATFSLELMVCSHKCARKQRLNLTPAFREEMLTPLELSSTNLIHAARSVRLIDADGGEKAAF